MSLTGRCLLLLVMSALLDQQDQGQQEQLVPRVALVLLDRQVQELLEPRGQLVPLALMERTGQMERTAQQERQGLRGQLESQGQLDQQGQVQLAQLVLKELQARLDQVEGAYLG